MNAHFTFAFRMLRTISLSLLLATISRVGLAQSERPLTLEAIFSEGLLTPETVSSIRWMNDGRYYTAQVSEDTAYYQHILRYDATTGEAVDTLVNGRRLVLSDEATAGNPLALAYEEYELSPQEDKVLFATEVEPVYRRSRRAYYYVYDLASKTLRPLISECWLGSSILGESFGSTSAPPPVSTTASIMLIAGAPMKPATKTLSGVS